MIAVTRLDGSVMVVNDEQIAWIETRPDTVISMMNGEKLLVREGPDTLVERTRDFKRSVLTHAPIQLARHAAVASPGPRSGRFDAFPARDGKGSDGEDA